MRRLAFALSCIAYVTQCRRLDLKHTQPKEASDPLRALAKHLLAFNPGTEYGRRVVVDRVIGDRGLASQLKRKHQLRSNMPMMVDDAASVEVQIAQLQAQMEILKRQKEITELQNQLAAMQQQQGQVMQPVQPAAPVIQQPPASVISQLPTPVTSPPAQLAAVQQQQATATIQPAAPATATMQPAAPVMPAPAEPLQTLAAQSAQVSAPDPAALPVDATQAADAGDPMASAAGAVSAVQESFASIWQQGEEGLSMIFQSDAVADKTSDYPDQLPDAVVLTFVFLIIIGIGVQQLSLGDIFGEEKTAFVSSAQMVNRNKQRRSMYVKGGERRPFE